MEAAAAMQGDVAVAVAVAVAVVAAVVVGSLLNLD